MDDYNTSSGVYYYGSNNQLLSHALVMNSVFVGGSINSAGYFYKREKICVLSGGIANGTILYPWGEAYVESHGVVNSTLVDYAGTLYILAGGSAYDTIVISYYGSIYVSSGGVARKTTISNGQLHVSSGGLASDDTINTNGVVNVSTGGIVIDTTVSSSGRLIVSSGGTAVNPEISSGGTLSVLSGAVASNATIEPNGVIEVRSGGTAIDISISSDSLLYFDLANNTYIAGTSAGSSFEINGQISDYTVSSSVRLNISSGGRANSITLIDNGYIYVYSDGVIEDIVNTAGWMFISSGGKTKECVINFSGCLYVSSGGIAENMTINSGGAVPVFGGKTNNTTINSGGTLRVWSSGEAQQTIIEGGQLYVYEGYASNVILRAQANRNQGDLYVGSEGIVDDLQIEQYGDCYVSSGGKVSKTFITSYGAMYVSFGGTIDHTFVNSCGSLTISFGGKAESTTVNSGGRMIISSGGTATEIAENGGYVVVADDAVVTFASNTISNLVLSTAPATVHSGTTATKTMIGSYCYLYVSGGGLATDTIVNPNGHLVVESGGTATIAFNPWQGDIVSSNSAIVMHLERDANVYYGGNVAGFINKADTLDNLIVESGNNAIIYSGGCLNTTTIKSGGKIDIQSGGTANHTSVACSASMCVISGASATDITAEYAAQLDFAVAPNTYIEGKCGDSTFEIKDGVANDYMVNPENIIRVYSGGTANITTINFRGELHVSSGGIANNTVVNSCGLLFVSNGGIADSTTVSSGGNFYANGGSVNDTIVYSGGNLLILSGGTAQQTMIESGVLRVSNGGYASVVILRAGADRNQGDIYVSAGGVVEDVQVEQYGDCYVSFRGVANNVTVNDGGCIYISSSGTATIAFNPWQGSIFSSAGAVVTYLERDAAIYYGNREQGIISKTDTVENLIIESGLSVIVFSGGTTTNLIASNGACVFFDVAPDTYVQGTFDGSAFEMKEGYISGYTINSGCRLAVSSGGLADATVVNSRGSLHVSSGGATTNTAISGGGNIIVCSGGIADSTTVSSGGNLHVSSGGIADNTLMSSGGRGYIFAGGTANNAIVSSGGSLFVSSGGTAQQTEVASGGSCIVSNGGIVERTTVSNGGNLYANGGSVNDTIVYSGGNLWISSGGTANKTTINSSGQLHISSGGSATNIEENGGYVWLADGATATFVATTHSGLDLDWSMTAHSGTTAVSTTISSNGKLHVCGGIADTTIVSNGGRLYISSGGTANSTILSSGAEVYIYGGGTANNTLVNGRGYYYVFSGGMANLTEVASGGGLSVSSGGTAVSTTVSSGGNLWISSGGTAQQTMIESGMLRVFDGGYASGIILRAGADRNQGDIYVSAGGVVEDVQVEQYGDCYVSSGGLLNNATINAGGYLRVENSGTATAIKENGGYVDVQNGAEVAFAANTFSGVELVNASATIHSGTTANKTTVGANSYLYIYEDGSATETTVDSGYFYVLSDGTATKTTVNSNGQLQISSGGVATSTSVNSGGRFYVLSGATVTEATAASGAYLDFSVTPDTLITGTSGGSAFTIKEGVLNDGYTLETARLELGVRVKATNTTVNSGGQLYVSTGAAANGIIENGGSVEVEEEAEVSFTQNTFSGLILSNTSATVHSGTTAVSTIASSGGRLRVYLNGIADGVDVNGGGFLYVSSGGTATTIKENGGYVSAAEGANVTFESANLEKLILLDSASIHSNTRMTSTTVSRGGIAVSSGGIADTTILLSGKTRIFSGGVANSTTIYSYAGLEISSGGVASGVDIKSRGSANVVSGGTLRDLNISSGGTLNLDRGKITGKVMIENGAYVRTYGSGTLDFDISGITPDAEVRVNNLSMISGSLQYTLTVGIQRSGTYELAGGALRFNSAITVLNTDGVQLGMLTTTNPLTTAKATYTLVSFGESLSVEVEAFTPAAPTASADVTDSTTQAVTVTAVFGEDCTVREYSYDGKDWLAYTEPIVFTENGTVYFRGADAAGNFSEITSYEVKNIEPVSPDTTAPSDPTGLRAFIERQDVALVWNVSTDDLSGVKEYVVTYSFNGQDFTVRTSGTSYVLNNADLGSYSWSVQAVDFAGNESAIIAGDTFTVSGFKPYTVEYSADNFEHVITFAVMTPSLDAFRIPGGTYQLRVRQEGSSEWLTGDPIVAEDTGDAPQLVKSDADGNADVFFANSIGTWKSGYLAQHVGSTADTWGGTKEYASLYGKNKLADIIEGSTDANILLMTDDENGDALFVDDIYTALPGSVSEQQSRIAQIDEIRAGFGNDIVDMTSQRFEYIGEGLTIRGGEGNDTIWANKGDNRLFGDAGNDRIVGASGNDLIAGGIGNDRMHGGGGNDVFTFCENWGSDTVEQLESGSVTLWFTSGSMDNWDSSSLTYTDGDNCVKVSGITADKITLIFGDNGSDQFGELSGMGTFFDATSECIFEESGKGILASL